MAVTAPPTPRRYTPVAVLAVTLGVFALVVAYVSWWLRSGLQQQVLNREAEALTEVASLQLANEADAMARLGVSDVPGELLNAVLKTSKMRGVFAVRVFDAAKHFNGAVPLPWSEVPPDDADWRDLVAGHAIARLHSRESAAEVIGLAPPRATQRASEPLLETWLPLRRADGAPLAGVAQMWTDGHTIAGEFTRLDRQIWVQAVTAWLGGAMLISALILWGFHRLAEANRQLQARGEDLLRANRELAMAAKSSALGAVAAHLMHELKNPVAGLEEYVASQAELGGRGEGGGELAAASELTGRLRRMINDVAAVMRDEQSGAHFELTGREIVELARAKVAPLAREHGVELECTADTDVEISGRRANLAILVLNNLLQNAIEASPAGKNVRVHATAEDGLVRFQVEDDGSGLDPRIRQRLFEPVTSTKPGGSGLGLALSQQIARQASGRIELVRSDPTGTCFQLVLELTAET